MSIHRTVPFPAAEELPGPEASSEWAFSWPNTADFNFNYFELLLRASDSAIGDLRGASVAIVGAGIAGLAAARELFRCGVTNLTIYEASDRIGGRNCSVAVPGQSTVMEMGAMRMPFFIKPGDGKCVLDYYDDLFGIDTMPFPDPHAPSIGNTGIWVNDGYGPDPENPLAKPEMLLWPKGQLPPTPLLRSILEKWEHFASLFTGKESPVIAAYNAGGATWQRMWQEIVGNYWNLNFRELVLTEAIKTYDPSRPGYFGGLGMNATEAQAFYTIGAGDGSWGAFYDVSCLFPIRTLLFGYATEHQLIVGLPRGGVPWSGNDGPPADSAEQLLPIPLFRGVQTFSECLFYAPVISPYVPEISLYQATANPGYEVRLYTRTPVVGLAANPAKPGGVIVTAGDGTKTAFDAVIATPTTWALQMSCQIAFPAEMLPFETRQSLHASHWISSTKIFYPLKQRYWEVSNIPQVINTDTFLQDVYGYAVGKDPGVLLLSYTWEDDANKLDAYPDDAELAGKALATLDEITRNSLGTSIAQYVDTSSPVVFKWARQPSYRGCAKLYRENSWTMDYALLTHNQQQGKASGLYFAGEGYSVEGGWTEPALRLALDAVIHIVEDRGGAFLNGFQYSLYPQYDTSFDPSASESVTARPKLGRDTSAHQTPLKATSVRQQAAQSGSR